jgi:uncharacterized paraquat-inducible protein A
MNEDDFKRKLFWDCIERLGQKGCESAAKLAENALHVKQHTQPAKCPRCGAMLMTFQGKPDRFCIVCSCDTLAVTQQASA